jgi:1,4-dihydroxy-2-naphthoate octaprenyltransferase
MEDLNVNFAREELSIFRKINLIFRFSYTIPFLLASVCGIVYAIPYGVPAHITILIPIVVLLMAVLVNFTNDYFDHMSGIDYHVSQQRLSIAKSEIHSNDILKKIYWEGNQFDTGLITEKQGRMIILALCALTVLLAFPVVIYGGWIALVLGLTGMFFTFFYTAPPINFAAHGMGEIVVGISFFFMCFGSFIVATGTYDIPIVLFSLLIGLVVGLMRLGDSLSAHDAHIQFGERCISVRLGLDGTIPIIKTIIVICYLLVFALMYYNLIFGLIFFTLIFTTKIWKALNERFENWEVKMIPYFFGFSFFTEVLFIVSLCITAFTGNLVFW